MNGEICSPPKEEELKLKGFAYLLKLEADQNHNRYYRMVQEGDRFKIEMGRIGARPVCMIRPMTLWDTTYQKKIKEGYEDRLPMESEIQNRYSEWTILRAPRLPVNFTRI